VQGIWGAAALAEALLKRRTDGTWLRRRTSSTAWRNCQMTSAGWCVTSGLCGCTHCLLNPVVTRAATENFGSGIARWQSHSVSRDTCSGPRRWSERSDSRRRPPEALKTLAGVGGSDRRQVNGISRLIRMSIRAHFFPADPSLENATTGTPALTSTLCGGGAHVGVPDGGGCGDLKKRHNHAQLCPKTRDKLRDSCTVVAAH